MFDFTPMTTSEMVFTNTQTEKVICDILQQKISFPSNGKNILLLYGVFGSGKTTYANIFFNEYESMFGGDNAYVNNIVVDNNEKITTTIERMDKSAQFIPFNQSNKHYFFIDEVDGYKIPQQRRLKSWLSREDIVCVMTTNYLCDIDKGLLSRSYVLEFNACSNPNNYVKRMKQIIRQNKMTMIDNHTLMDIATSTNGDWREMCALLQQACNNASH
jgi:replication-associated recombination protein RarA